MHPPTRTLSSHNRGGLLTPATPTDPETHTVKGGRHAGNGPLGEPGRRAEGAAGPRGEGAARRDCGRRGRPAGAQASERADSHWGPDATQILSQ